MEWPHDNEVLFKLDTDWHFNACINPRSMSLARYGQYYKEAADILIGAATDGDAYVDSVVYPAAFLYRHYLELTFKDIIWRARRLAHEGNGYPITHKLRELWNEAKRLISLHYGDDAPKELSNVDSCIDEFDTHDRESFTFRYPTDKVGNPNLLGLKHINLRNLKETMHRISNLVDCMAADIEAHWDAC